MSREEESFSHHFIHSPLCMTATIAITLVMIFLTLNTMVWNYDKEYSIMAVLLLMPTLFIATIQEFYP
jgi:hypothetical protein